MHRTVGDVTSLMLGPMVAACGGYIPMISGRGLGHTGGTLDKLESIPGFDIFPDDNRFREIIKDVGVAIIHAKDENSWQEAAKAVKAAIKLADKAPESTPTVYRRISE